MSLHSGIYALFLAITVICYWSVPKGQAKGAVLLVASLFFYGAWQWWYLPLLLGIAIGNWLLGQWLGQLVKRNSMGTARFWLGIGITANILVLAGYKYLPFLLSSVAGAWLGMVGTELALVSQAGTWIKANLVTPLGISFFTFEAIAYLVESYRQQNPPADHWLHFGAYKLFFPKLISGPITNYTEFVAQVARPKFPLPYQWTEGLWLIAYGSAKKVVVADRLGGLVSLIFTNLERAGSLDLWLAIIAYGLQLYLDFSGYVDLVRGSALLLGINLPENFNFPYFATSIADFWRRWHITLGAWLRNYLYIPLGGSRHGLTMTCINLFLVMLVAGIWHGSAWGFVIWGVIHGLALVGHRLGEILTERSPWLQVFWKNPLGIVTGWLITQMTVFLAWVYFRLPDINQAHLVLSRLWSHPADAQFAQKVYQQSLGIAPEYLWALLGLIWLIMGLSYLGQQLLQVHLNWHFKALFVPLLLFWVWMLAPQGTLPFIYFDF